MGSARGLANEADKYIRTVKGGRYQARPYDAYADNLPAGKRRYTIPGTFATKHEARKVILDFWCGKVPEVVPGTRKFECHGQVRYRAIFFVFGQRVRIREWFETREDAARAIRKWLKENYAKWPLLLYLLLDQYPEVQSPCAIA